MSKLTEVAMKIKKEKLKKVVVDNNYNTDSNFEEEDDEYQLGNNNPNKKQKVNRSFESTKINITVYVDHQNMGTLYSYEYNVSLLSLFEKIKQNFDDKILKLENRFNDLKVEHTPKLRYNPKSCILQPLTNEGLWENIKNNICYYTYPDDLKKLNARVCFVKSNNLLESKANLKESKLNRSNSPTKIKISDMPQVEDFLKAYSSNEFAAKKSTHSNFMDYLEKLKSSWGKYLNSNLLSIWARNISHSREPFFLCTPETVNRIKDVKFGLVGALKPADFLVVPPGLEFEDQDHDSNDPIAKYLCPPMKVKVVYTKSLENGDTSNDKFEHNSIYLASETLNNIALDCDIVFNLNGSGLIFKLDEDYCIPFARLKDEPISKIFIPNSKNEVLLFCYSNKPIILSQTD